MKNNNSIINKIYIFLLLILLMVLISLGIINKVLVPKIEDYANVRLKKISIDALRNTGLDEINHLLEKEKLYDVILNNNGEIESIDYNVSVLNKSLMIVAKSVRKKIKNIQKGQKIDFKEDVFDKTLKNGIIFLFPLLIGTDNILLSNIGPKIPIKVIYTGDVSVDIKTSVKPYGVNSALIEVYIYVEVFQKTILPFSSKTKKVTSKLPIMLKVVKGSYNGYISNNDNLYKLKID